MKILKSALILAALYLVMPWNALPVYGQINNSSPNILWITSEDNSPFLGCYGDKNATTPNLDQLAREGFRYTNAYANCPVCSPVRNTIITGVYAASNRNEQMRSAFRTSELIQAYSAILMRSGYYCTNNVKTDYNTVSIDPKQVWDESSNRAHVSDPDLQKVVHKFYADNMEGKQGFGRFNEYDWLMSEALLKKWGG